MEIKKKKKILQEYIIFFFYCTNTTFKIFHSKLKKIYEHFFKVVVKK